MATKDRAENLYPNMHQLRWPKNSAASSKMFKSLIKHVQQTNHKEQKSLHRKNKSPFTRRSINLSLMTPIYTTIPDLPWNYPRSTFLWKKVDTP